jgi:hypothetical protein
MPPWHVSQAGQSACVWHGGPQVAFVPGRATHTSGALHDVLAHAVGGPIGLASALPSGPDGGGESGFPVGGPPASIVPSGGPWTTQSPSPASWLSSVEQSVASPTATTALHRDRGEPVSVVQHAASVAQPNAASGTAGDWLPPSDGLPPPEATPPHAAVDHTPRTRRTAADHFMSKA